MGQVFGTYVGQEPIPRRNYRIGMDQGIWGLKGSAFERGDTGAQMRSVAVGDTLVFGHQGPSRSGGRWRDPTFRAIAYCKIIESYFCDFTPVWPVESDGEVYEHRIRFSVEQQFSGRVRLPSPELVEAVFMSQTKQGALVLASPGMHDPLQGGPGLVLGRSDPLPGVPDRLLDIAGVTDAASLAVRRTEQARLRKACVGAGPTARCALCGRVLPVGFLRAAHIKKRADATEEERLHTANVMAACVLGCDELFERGIVVVDPDGVVHQRGDSAATDLDAVIAAIVGRTCPAHTLASAEYFAAHASSHE